MAESKNDEKQELNQEEVFDFLGLDETPKDIDEFKSKFGETFIRKDSLFDDEDVRKKMTGKFGGVLVTELVKLAKNNDVEISKSELKEEKWEDITAKVVGQIVDKKQEKIKELEETLESSDTDEQVKELNGKIESLQKKLDDEKELKEAAVGKYGELETKYNSDMKNMKLNIHKKNLYDKAKWSSEADELRKKGFISQFEEEVNFDLNDNDELIVTDKDGNKIKSDKVADSFLTPDEVLEKKMIEKEVYQKNDKAPKQPKQETHKFNQKNNGQADDDEKYIHPSAVPK